jgi:hypothetical protein
MAINKHKTENVRSLTDKDHIVRFHFNFLFPNLGRKNVNKHWHIFIIYFPITYFRYFSCLYNTLCIVPDVWMNHF